MEIIFTIIIGYLFGCIQTSFFLVKLIKGVDIRTLGNNNAGASNTTASIGWKYGILVGIIDVLKAVVSINLIAILFKDYSNLIFLKYLNGLFVILGHNYPFFLNFKGGKGTASLIGMMLSINFKLGICGILLMIFITIFTQYIALATISTLIFFVLFTIYSSYGLSSILISIIIALLGIYKHLDNIKNIKNKTEKKLSSTLKK